MTLKSNLIDAIIQYKIHKRHKIPYNVMESAPGLETEVNICGLGAGFSLLLLLLGFVFSLCFGLLFTFSRSSDWHFANFSQSCLINNLLSLLHLGVYILRLY